MVLGFLVTRGNFMIKFRSIWDTGARTVESLIDDHWEWRSADGRWVLAASGAARQTLSVGGQTASKSAASWCWEAAPRLQRFSKHQRDNLGKVPSLVVLNFRKIQSIWSSATCRTTFVVLWVWKIKLPRITSRCWVGIYSNIIHYTTEFFIPVSAVQKSID